jgi:enoyl-CoA hydratase
VIVRGLNVSFTKLFSFPKPTITAIGGAAIAGGLFFVLASDYRVATRNAKFGLAEVRVGADFPIGPLEIARAMLNPNDLRRLMLSGQPIGIDAALLAGIVDKVVEVENLRDTALDVARDYAQIPPKTFAEVKRQIRSGTVSLIKNAMDNGENSPADGWFNDETKDAMAAMIGYRSLQSAGRCLLPLGAARGFRPH